jgi:DNA-binding transcriptional LysR family regulator
VTLHALPFGSESLARLEAGELDCSFWGGGPMPEPFRSRELFRDHPLGLVCATHPLAKTAKRRAPDLDEFLAYPHVKTTIENVATDPVDLALAAVGRARRIAVTTPSHSANFALMARTDSIMCPAARLTQEAARLGFVIFELPIQVAFNAYALLWHQRSETGPANQWLRELIATELTEV